MENNYYSFPVKYELSRRKVVFSDSCVMCGKYEEIVEPLFFLLSKFGLLQCVVLEWILSKLNQKGCD